ncbi:MAG: phage tail protein [Gemmatimonadales bacterium]|nr:phage tail protein [Gemmatimonadales bacterium]
MDLEHVVARLAHQVERRFYGKYRGFVVDNEDPEKLGRLKLTVPSVLGDEVVTGWAMPCVLYGGAADQGMLFVPDVDAGVWVEFEEGDLEFPIWVGTFWSKPGGESELPKPNDADGAEQGEVQSPPTRKIIKTARKHTLQLEDADGEVRILISDGQEENRIVLGESGITIVNKRNSITMSDREVVIAEGEEANRNTITMSSTAGSLGKGIDLNGGSRICLEGLITWLLTHTHVGNMGGPTPLSPGSMVDLVQARMPGAGNGILSDEVRAK